MCVCVYSIRSGAAADGRMGSFVSWLLLGLLTTPSFSLGNTAFFTKVYVDGGDAPCATTNTLYLTKEFTHAREIYCPFRCAQDPSCTLCTFTDGQCKLYTLKLTPNVACAVSGRGTVGYSRLPKDLALYKHVDYSSMVTDHIGIFSEITNDATSWQSFTYCPCTTNQGSEWVRVDLEKTYLVSSILLTASADVRETYFKTVKIHVGNTGDVHYDPVVAVKSAATPSPYQVLQYDAKAQFPCSAYQCEDEELCLPTRYVCDGEPDCVSGDDEVDCEYCRDGFFKCPSSEFCIVEHYVCDGLGDCPNSDDEANCTYTTAPVCEPEQYQCFDGLCIDEQFVCDGIVDCYMADDEQECQECKEGYHCQNDLCIPDIYLCDDYENCIRGEDEKFCPCDPTDFICTDGDCIPEQYRCDGYYDCFGGSDEENCGVSESPISSDTAPRRTHDTAPRRTRSQSHLLRKLRTMGTA